MRRGDFADCGVALERIDHVAEWAVTMTSPEGVTGIEIRHCTLCMVKLLNTPAVQTMGRTVHLKKLEGRS